MKKSKFLLPIIGVVGTAATIAPAIMLTSCGDGITNVDMILNSTTSTNVWAGKNNGRLSFEKDKTYRINLEGSHDHFGYICIQIINGTTFGQIATDATINSKAIKFEYDGAGGFRYKIIYAERFLKDMTIEFKCASTIENANISAKFVSA